MSSVLARGARRVLEAALAAVLPADCWLCGGPLPWRQSGSVCVPCWRRLPWAPRLAARPGALSGVVTAASYEGPFRRLVHGLKFEGMDYLGAPLGQGMALRLGGMLDRLGPFDHVVPVPLHFTRRLRRGYNQAERLARPLAVALALPLATSVLRRLRAGPRQTALRRRERLRSLGGCFRARPLTPTDVPGRGGGPRVLLVDDVVTTGATLEACARALAAAGAADIVGCALARTPRAKGRAGAPRPGISG
jgi:ComF family protein